MKISAVMPVYNGIKYLKESIQSIKEQSFGDWEFIIVNEFGSDDGSEEFIEYHASLDNRIKLIQNTERLGLAESLNVAIRAASGEYIARVDVDDPSYPERFATQISYMDAHQHVVLCGTLQRSVLPNRSKVECVETEQEALKAALLFGCEISHCSVMFRREDFLQNNWWYDKDSLCEDYDLWTKIMFKKAIVNINQVLVDHRWGFDNISIAKGEKLREATRNVSKRTLLEFGIDIEKENIDKRVLSGWRSMPKAFAVDNAEYFLAATYKLNCLLIEKNKEKKLIIQKDLERVLRSRWYWACQCCEISCQTFNERIDEKISSNRIITIAMFIEEFDGRLTQVIDSIVMQTYREWNLEIYTNCGSEGIAAICNNYSQYDSRITFSYTDKKKNEIYDNLIQTCVTDFVLFTDSFTIMYPEKLEKLKSKISNDHNLGAVGNSYLARKNVVLVDTEPSQCKANLLAKNENLFSSIIFRLNQLRKNNIKFSEDSFLFLSQIVKFLNFGNTAEVLNKTFSCKSIAYDFQVLAYNLEYNLEINYSSQQLEQILNGISEISIVELLKEIWQKNGKNKYYKKQSLLNVLGDMHKGIEDNSNWKQARPIYCWERVFDENCKLTLNIRIKKFLVENTTFRKKAKTFLQFVHRNKNGLQERLERHISDITWDRYKRTEKELSFIKSELGQLKEMQQKQLQQLNLTKLYGEEKIRIVFLYQVASFWPSWESFWYACQKDDRVDARLVWLNETNTEKYQMKTALPFLKKNSIPYTNFEEFNFEEFSPHVVVYQTPYDKWHRQYQNWTENMIKRGVRIVYVPYGIEIADTKDARRAHFFEKVILNSWRIYTFSDKMLQDYQKYCPNRDAVRSVGIPKFDGLFSNNRFALEKKMTDRIQGRKIILWKVHFPKVIFENGLWVQCTPALKEYLEFVSYIEENRNIFFIFMPHPRFTAENNSVDNQNFALQILNRLARLENVYLEQDDDYRKSMINADAIIVDRSAVMVEAGAVGVPVLYMYNKSYSEPCTQAIEPLIFSYYQGTSVADMVSFVDMLRQGKDPLARARQAAFSECIPYFDGKSGERILQDIIEGLKRENEVERSVSKKKEENTQQLIMKNQTDILRCAEEIHSHIDFTYRDVMVVLEKQLNFVGEHNLVLNTQYPCAYQSNDYVYPRGTVQDNTRFPRFIKKCELLLNKERELSFLDLGCSGGGMVLDAIIRGHLGIGLEGSDLSLINQRAEWRLLRDNLFTCDITKPFLIADASKGEVKKFNVITAWEVLEHISELDLEQLFSNIKKHLDSNGFFVASIACWDDIDSETGVNWHVTVREKDWWVERFCEWGFELAEDMVQKQDLARGGINHPIVYKKTSESSHKDEEFFIVLKTKK